MKTERTKAVFKETITLYSETLDRQVLIDFYLPALSPIPSTWSLLLINDGQDMETLGLEDLLESLYTQDCIQPVLCACIHAGSERKLEYGTANIPDYKGRGIKAKDYSKFIFEELIPHARLSYSLEGFKEKAFAGFSLGGLSAMDIVWNHPEEFSKVGVFSGSLWWRTKDKHDEAYCDETDRIMHRQVKNGNYYPWLKFFFECGAADEEHDRNNNGIIDSIDDTLDLIQELRYKGYNETGDICYLQIDDGKHDVATWARAMPSFLKWGWGSNT